MGVLIDPPAWPAHGTLWSHLVSDTSYEELHQFAAKLRIPRRSFDLDHYDVPQARYDAAVALGAQIVHGRDVVRVLQETGMRVRQIERDAVRIKRRHEYLTTEWDVLGTRVEQHTQHPTLNIFDWRHLGNELSARWNEEHRRYHNAQHLEDVLLALDHLALRDEDVSIEMTLAAWFHDAIYTGNPGEDEIASAQLAASALGYLNLEPGFIHRIIALIRATQPGSKHSVIAPQVNAFLDADIAIFAAPASRYDDYATSVREEYADVPTAEFRRARSVILESYLSRDVIYSTQVGQSLWEDRARENLDRETRLLRSCDS